MGDMILTFASCGSTDGSASDLRPVVISAQTHDSTAYTTHHSLGGMTFTIPLLFPQHSILSM